MKPSEYWRRKPEKRRIIYKRRERGAIFIPLVRTT
jgi:hypothetical protein